MQVISSGGKSSKEVGRGVEKSTFSDTRDAAGNRGETPVTIEGFKQGDSNITLYHGLRTHHSLGL